MFALTVFALSVLSRAEIGRTGKIMVLVAGLVGLLDLLSKKLTDWAKRAAERHDLSAAWLGRVRTIHRLRRLQLRMYWKAGHNLPFESRYFTSQEFAAFAQELRDTCGLVKVLNYDGPREALMKQSAKAARLIRDFLAARLNEKERAALDAPLPTDNERRFMTIVSAILLSGVAGIVALVTAGIVGTVDQFGLKLLGAIFGLMLLNAVVVLQYDDLAELATKAAASTQLGLARATRLMLGDGKAHPLRWAALLAFLAGSVLDLIASW
ncbi:hypothetical protein [Allorhizocola rhizosphaerae]|uniref:hypothetical protein n=1 Tax=Allorhizocola rhizosphaerae TaxID=1872709 RepID=UPI000E3E5F2F|nr:hypothetical protein [Allorhizocola rhizosphaerae]